MLENNNSPRSSVFIINFKQMFVHQQCDIVLEFSVNYLSQFDYGKTRRSKIIANCVML